MQLGNSSVKNKIVHFYQLGWKKLYVEGLKVEKNGKEKCSTSDKYEQNSIVFYVFIVFYTFYSLTIKLSHSEINIVHISILSIIGIVYHTIKYQHIFVSVWLKIIRFYSLAQMLTHWFCLTTRCPILLV